MKNLVIGMILGGILVIVLLLIVDVSINNQNLIGNAVNTYTTQQSKQLTEQVIIDDEQQINENIDYSQTFEVFKPTKILVELTSDELVNYALLSEYELEHYTKGENFKSYANQEIVFIQETYDLNAGKYSVVVSSKENPAEIHLIIKTT